MKNETPWWCPTCKLAVGASLVVGRLHWLPGAHHVAHDVIPLVAELPVDERPSAGPPMRDSIGTAVNRFGRCWLATFDACLDDGGFVVASFRVVAIDIVCGVQAQLHDPTGIAYVSADEAANTIADLEWLDVDGAL